MWLETFRISNLFGFKKKQLLDRNSSEATYVKWYKTGYNRLSDSLSDDYNGNHVQSSTVSFIYGDGVVNSKSKGGKNNKDGVETGVRQSLTLGSIEENLSDISYEDSDEDDEIICCVCDENFQTYRQLMRHRQKNRHFGCSICEEIFPSSSALDGHKEQNDHWSDVDEVDEESWEDVSDSDDVSTPLQEKFFI
ncbi:uncharacterized protein LOC136040405 isoform X2 [Artemia franciscana]|uniref:uncharacterized protein LOC136040405 isoform X2 n=1 Tax=Artemia franciscana TaxID=6661 RepID=UPI0032DA2243